MLPACAHRVLHDRAEGAERTQHDDRIRNARQAFAMLEVNDTDDEKQCEAAMCSERTEGTGERDRRMQQLCHEEAEVDGPRQQPVPGPAVGSFRRAEREAQHKTDQDQG